LLDGGKRLRPVLCLTFADSVARASNGGGEPANDAAVALECIHTYSLIHDDLPSMDDDDLRRGRPTSHKAFGEAMAILAGDALQTDAFALVARGPEHEQALRGRLAGELAIAAGSGGMVGGQVLDIADDRPATLDYLNRLHRLKTGALIRAACRMGAIAGRGDTATLDAAERYGDAVGLAFQIADDVLDATASAEETGKATGKDAAAGKATLVSLLGLERARLQAERLVAQAKDHLDGFGDKAGLLRILADFVIARRS
jgi:geranylgeranyl diphosphate synthase type II